MYKNILVYLENSEFDEDAIEAAADLAITYGGRISLMVVIEILSLRKKDKHEEYAIVKERSARYLLPIKQRLEKKNVNTDIVIKAGTAGMVICQYAEENDIDLIVMPVHAVDTKTRLVAGYTARQVLDHSPKTVLFVRGGSKDILRGRRILVVDDEPDILDIVEEELDMCVVRRAQDQATALELIENEWFDIVILDIMGVDGFKILEKTVKLGLPTVMLTAHAMTKESLQQAAKLGATSFIPKEKMSELDIFLADVIKNAGKPVWKKLFERMSSYFDSKFGWTPEEEQILVSEYDTWDDK